MRNSHKSKTSERGHAVVEVALMAPWILILFVALFDFGFYAYALISVENAARVAALYTSYTGTAASDSAEACYLVVQELGMLPNVASMATSATPSCSASPLSVTAVATNATSTPPSPDGQPGTQVTVTYTTVQLFPLPWILGQMTITRVVDARVKTS